MQASIGTIILLASLIIAVVLVVEQSDVHAPSAWKLGSKLFWKNATVRPPMLIILVVAGWGWVVSVCERLDTAQVLGGELQPASATYHAALLLLCVLLAGHLFHIWASETPGITWRPWLVANCTLNAAFLAIGAMPCRLFFSASRLSLLNTLWESAIAPFAPVTFWHVIVADYLTSMAKAFSDLQLTTCISYGIFFHTDDAAAGVSITPPISSSSSGGPPYLRTTDLWHAMHGSCSNSPWNALALALPFWMRLMQCLKVYSQTGEAKNLWNALKYSTAFPLVYAGFLKKQDPSEFHDRCFVAAAALQSSYCFIWDVHMDWGLFRHANLFGRSPEERGVSCCGAKPSVCRLREPLLITSSTSIYFLLCVVDLGLRFVWALSVFGGVPSRGLGMFFFECVEILRRTVWAIFRIEWEVVAKVIYPAGEYAAVNSLESPSSTFEMTNVELAKDDDLFDDDDED